MYTNFRDETLMEQRHSLSGTGARKTVDKLKRSVCIKYETKTDSRRNYSNKWVIRADSVRSSNIKDHLSQISTNMQ